MNQKVNFFFEKESKWQESLKALRAIALDCKLAEELKWGVPCYTFNKNNIVLIHAFKEYCAYLFFKGAIMKDPKQLLIQQTQNVQAARQIRFNDIDQILKSQKVLKTYILEAIAIEKSGEKVVLKKTTEFVMPDEFQKVLNSNKDIQVAFESLTPGRQRAYLLHFASPKQSKTREARIEKNIDNILNGKGLND